MKKTTIILAALFSTIGTFAATPTITAKLKLLVNSQNSFSADNIGMVESPSFSDGFDNGYDGTKYPTTGSAQIWVPTTFGDMATFATNNLEGTPITIQTISDEEYTFSFTNIEGRALKFIDYEKDSLTDITNTNTYTVTLAKNSKIAGRFAIYKSLEFQVCAYKDYIEITGNTGTDNIVITDMSGAEVVNVAPATPFQTIDLSGKDAGHYILTVNGTQYEFYNKPTPAN